jgi:hypothetical protein
VRSRSRPRPRGTVRSAFENPTPQPAESDLPLDPSVVKDGIPGRLSEQWVMYLCIKNRTTIGGPVNQQFLVHDCSPYHFQKRFETQSKVTASRSYPVLSSGSISKGGVKHSCRVLGVLVPFWSLVCQRKEFGAMEWDVKHYNLFDNSSQRSATVGMFLVWIWSD